VSRNGIERIPDRRSAHFEAVFDAVFCSHGTIDGDDGADMQIKQREGAGWLFVLPTLSVIVTV